MAKHEKKRFRAEFRKHHEPRTRRGDWAGYLDEAGEADEPATTERVTGKGALTRKRTVIGEAVDEAESGGLSVALAVDETQCLRGRVLCVHGLTSVVLADSGERFRCATRRLLKSLSTDLRHVVAAGDLVWFRPAPHGAGLIERIEPRHGVLSRTSRSRRHVIAVNVDQLLIVASAAEPYLKPNLIDRMLVTAEKVQVRPVVCINKVDLVDPANLQPLVGVYGQMGYQVLLLSATTGWGIPHLRRLVLGRESVVAGQSGVGKSSLLNAIEPGLDLKVRTVSAENEKGRHTTTTAQLIPLSAGGFIVDTPGIRQFQLWDVVPAELPGFYRDIRPYVSRCRFPDCSHTHEAECAIKDAVADGKLDVRRYESYRHLLAGDWE